MSGAPTRSSNRVTLAILVLLGAVAAAPGGLAPAARAEEGGYRRESPVSIPGYDKPSPAYPEPRGQAVRILDIGLFVGALALAGWLILKKRSRNGLIALMAASLLYFGFYRSGCVCPIGSIQNVVLSLVDSSYTISIVVTLLFLLPILAALFFGRIFCGGVCWLGACQDLIHRWAVRVPLWLDKPLRWLRWVYLALAVYWVIGGLHLWQWDLTVQRDFVICKYDPFINLFRSVNVRAGLARDWANVFQFAGPWWLWLITGLVLGTGIFIGRPYCRWLCPYGAILGVCARAAKKPVTVHPVTCCDCELCVEACPFGAIENHAAVQSSCQGCARCYLSCPLERERRGLAVPDYLPGRPPVQPPALPPVHEGPGLPAPAPVVRWPGRIRRIPAVAEDGLDLAYLDGLVRTLGRDRAASLPILQAIQQRHRYLPTPALERVVELTDVTLAQLTGLATFFNQFRLAPMGRHLVRMCHGTACHVAGARRINDVVRLHLGIPDEGDTDPARQFTIQEVACLGCCSLAPVMQIDDKTFGHLTPQKVIEVLDGFDGGGV